MSKYLVNKQGESEWHEVDAISGEDAIVAKFGERVLWYRAKGQIDIFDNFEGTQLFAVKGMRGEHNNANV